MASSIAQIMQSMRLEYIILSCELRKKKEKKTKGEAGGEERLEGTERGV